MSQMSQVPQDLAPDVEMSPDISHLVIEDDEPVDNLISEKQQRLLLESLYGNPALVESRPFLAAANVGVFYAIRQPPIVPDVFLSLDVEVPQDWRDRKNRTYLMWEFGKPPDVVIEIVSNREGNELGSKRDTYARIGVTYYAVFDPLQQLGDTLLQVFEKRGGRLEEKSNFWLDDIDLGLTIWEGTFEGKHDRWLRWTNADGTVFPTGTERAEQAEARANRLTERLRALGIDPDELEA
jgi:Uma2 family endonuclease